jgi:hypothetical protein
MTYQLNQTVIRRAPRSNEMIGKVVKVARKYCTVEFTSKAYGSTFTIEFDKETGVERDAPMYGVDRQARIKTLDEWAEHDATKRRSEALHALGMTLPRAITPEQVFQIAKVMGVE